MNTYTITLRTYGEEKKYREWDKENKYHYYEQIGEWTLPPKEFESLSDAENWILENFEDYWFCYGITCENGDFSFNADVEYYESILKVYDRKELIKKIKEKKAEGVL